MINDDFYILTAGIGKNGIYEKFTNAFIMERASVSTLPFAIDDPSQKPTKGSELSDIVVDLYNHRKVASLQKGPVLPHSIPLVATIYELQQEERFVSHLIRMHS